MTNTTENSSPDSPGPSPPSSSPSTPHWLSHVTTIVALVVVGLPIGLLAPELLRLYETKGDWKPFAAFAAIICFLVAPAPTLKTLRNLAPWKRKE